MIRNASNICWKVFTFLLYFSTVVFLIVGVAGIYALVKANNNETPILYFFEVIYKAISGQQVTAADRAVLEQFVNASVYAFTVLVTIISAVFLVDARRKLKKSIKRELPYVAKDFTTKPADIHIHAVPIMKKFYENAAYLKVISGDYDWILKDKGVSAIIIRLVKQGKAELYSYKQKDVVEKAWRSQLPDIGSNRDLETVLQAIKYGTKGKYKASLIEYTGGGEALVFLSLPFDDEELRHGDLKKYAVLEYTPDPKSKTIIDMAKFVFASNKNAL